MNNHDHDRRLRVWLLIAAGILGIIIAVADRVHCGMSLLPPPQLTSAVVLG
jgi:hypothetical protein